MRSVLVKALMMAVLSASAAQVKAQGNAPATSTGNDTHADAAGGLTLELETGAVAYSRNDVRIPNDGGTRFDLRDLTGSGPELYGRLALTWRLNERHVLRFTAAPLRTSGTGTLENDVIFEDTEFQGGESTQGVYQFSNYRVTYRRMFAPGE